MHAMGGLKHVLKPYCSGSSNGGTPTNHPCDWPKDLINATVHGDGDDLLFNINSYQLFTQAFQYLVSNHACYPQITILGPPAMFPDG